MNLRRTAVATALVAALTFGSVNPALAHQVDDSGPLVTVSWSDLPRVVPGGLAYLNVVVGDESGVDRVEWWVDGALRSTGNNLAHDFGAASRTAVVEVRAWDVLGNTTQQIHSVTVDADAPKVVSAVPKARALVRGSSVTATLRLSDVSGVQFATPVIGGSGKDRTAPYTGRFVLGKDGTKTLKWYVVDYWSQWKHVYQTVVVDNTKPALTVTKGPKNGAKVKDTVRLAATAKDKNGIARVELLVNGKVVATDTKAGYAFAIDATKYGQKLKIRLRAYDKAGNVRVTSVRTWYR